MIILSTQERKDETKTLNENFAKKVRTCRLPLPGNVKITLETLRFRTATATNTINH
jgi:hypothetical protein